MRIKLIHDLQHQLCLDSLPDLFIDQFVVVSVVIIEGASGVAVDMAFLLGGGPDPATSVINIA